MNEKSLFPTNPTQYNTTNPEIPSLTACLANSPGSKSLTAVCISRDVIVCLLLYLAKRQASRKWARTSIDEGIKHTSGELLENISDKTVHDTHGLVRNTSGVRERGYRNNLHTSVRVNLFQYFVNKSRIGGVISLCISVQFIDSFTSFSTLTLSAFWTFSLLFSLGHCWSFLWHAADVHVLTWGTCIHHREWPAVLKSLRVANLGSSESDFEKAFLCETFTRCVDLSVLSMVTLLCFVSPFNVRFRLGCSYWWPPSGKICSAILLKAVNCILCCVEILSTSREFRVFWRYVRLSRSRSHS